MMKKNLSVLYALHTANNLRRSNFLPVLQSQSMLEYQLQTFQKTILNKTHGHIHLKKLNFMIL